MIKRQELYCHGCNGYVQFNLDTSLNGNHVLNCPKCGHQHHRYVNNGIIEGAMRSTPNVLSYRASSTTWTSTSTWDTYTSSDTTGTGGPTFLYEAWMDTGTGV